MKATSSNGIRVEAVQDLNRLEGYTDAWDRLARSAPLHLPTVSSAWVTSFIEHQLKRDEGWLCLLAFLGRELVGVLPVVLPQAGRSNRSTLSIPSNADTPVVDILLAPGHERSALASLLSALAEAEPGHIALSVPAVATESPTLEVIKGMRQSCYVHLEFRRRGSYITTTGSYTQYFSNLGSSFRQNLRTAKNKLDNLRAVFHIGSHADAKELSRFVTIEDSGWKGKKGTSILRLPGLLTFYGALTRRLAKAGWLEWHFLEARGTTIAAQLGVRMGPVLYIWKMAYNDKFARCSPGNILLEETLRRAFTEEGIDEVNLLTYHPSHTAWRMQSRSYYEMLLHPPTARSLLRSVLPRKIRSLLRGHKA